jgi:hypothetical protein
MMLLKTSVERARNKQQPDMGQLLPNKPGTTKELSGIWRN